MFRKAGGRRGGAREGCQAWVGRAAGTSKTRGSELERERGSQCLLEWTKKDSSRKRGGRKAREGRTSRREGAQEEKAQQHGGGGEERATHSTSRPGGGRGRRRETRGREKGERGRVSKDGWMEEERGCMRSRYSSREETRSGQRADGLKRPKHIFPFPPSRPFSTRLLSCTYWLVADPLPFPPPLLLCTLSIEK